MLNRVQRRLLTVGVCVATMAVMLFICSIQRQVAEAQLQAEAEKRSSTKTLIYIDLEIQQARTLGIRTMFEDTYQAIAARIGDTMLCAPIVEQRFEEVPITLEDGRDVRYGVRVLGTSPAYGEIVDIRVTAGRFLEETDTFGCVVSQSFLDFNGLAYEEGMRLSIRGTLVPVLGAYAYGHGAALDAGGLFSYMPEDGHMILLPYGAMRQALPDGGPGQLLISHILAKPRESLTYEETVRLNGVVAQDLRENVEIPGEDGRLQAQTEYEIYRRTRTGYMGTVWAGIAVSLLLLLVAGLNILQLVRAAMEDNRSRLALRMAVGATPGAVGRELFLEILWVHAKGGYAGITFSSAMVAMLNHYTGEYLFAFTPLSLLLGLMGVFLLSALCFLLPARNLSRMDPAGVLGAGGGGAYFRRTPPMARHLRMLAPDQGGRPSGARRAPSMQRLFACVEMFVIAAAMNVGLCVNQSQIEMMMRSVERFGVSVEQVLVVIAYMNFYIVALLAVCGLGMLGMLLSEINRRKKELALHMACGATPHFIYRMVILSYTLRTAALPAALGFFLSTGLLIWLDRSGIPVFGNALSFDVGLLAVALGGMLALCLLAALYPAVRASKLSVAQALASQ